MNRIWIFSLVLGLLLFGCISKSAVEEPAVQDETASSTEATPQAYTCPDGSIVDDFNDCPETWGCPDGTIVYSEEEYQACMEGYEPKGPTTQPTEEQGEPGASGPEGQGSTIMVSGNNMNSHSLVSKGLDEIVLTQTELREDPWQEINSWGDYEYEVDVNYKVAEIVDGEYSGCGKGYYGNLEYGRFDYSKEGDHTECLDFFVTVPKTQQISIFMMKTEDIESAEHEFDYLLEEYSEGIYEKKEDPVIVGNEMFTAEGVSQYGWWEYNIVFRRNNVIIEMRMRDPYDYIINGKDPWPEREQFKEEAPDYALIMDEKIR
jgi:hypothetical protein